MISLVAVSFIYALLNLRAERPEGNLWGKYEKPFLNKLGKVKWGIQQEHTLPRRRNPSIENCLGFKRS